MKKQNSNNFEAYNEFIHKSVLAWIKDKNWTTVRPIQQFALEQLSNNTEDDLILFAPTAGGKTMAAFIPLLSEYLKKRNDTNDDQQKGYYILYICPTKALINQQAEEENDISQLAKICNIPVTPWMGDVAVGKKERSWESPDGILVITPESLEARFVKKYYDIERCFGNLRAIVIDELHIYFESERGAQVISLLSRLEAIVSKRIQRIALSATLGDGSDKDLKAVYDFLRPNNSLKNLPKANIDYKSEITIHLEIFEDEDFTEIGNQSEKTRREIANSINLIFDEQQKGIIFTNSRREAERFTNLLNNMENALTKLPDWSKDKEEDEKAEYDELEGSPKEHKRSKAKKENINPEVFPMQNYQDKFNSDNLLTDPRKYWPHHGSLNKTIRSHAEKRMRLKDVPCILVATTTLELGIDIGEIKKVAQIGPGISVSSLRQRLGRSGRPRNNQNSKPELYIYVREAFIDENSEIINRLRLPSFQTLAQIALLNEGKFESPNLDKLHLSTVVQQLLSLLYQSRENSISRKDIEQILVENGPFKNLKAPLNGFDETNILRGILRRLLTRTPALIDIDIQESEDKIEYFLTSHGEKIINAPNFFTAFKTPIEYTVKLHSTVLGTLGLGHNYGVMDKIIYNGKTYEITGINHNNRVIEVRNTESGSPVYFSGDALFPSEEVINKMKDLYVLDNKSFEDFLSKNINSLNEKSKVLLLKAKDEFVKYLNENSLIIDLIDEKGDRISRKVFIWFPWVGEKELLGIVDALKHAKINAVAFRVCIILKNSNNDSDFLKTLLKKIESILKSFPSSSEIIRNKGVFYSEKFDHFLTPTLWRKERELSQSSHQKVMAKLDELKVEISKHLK